MKAEEPSNLSHQVIFNHDESNACFQNAILSKMEEYERSLSILQEQNKILIEKERLAQEHQFHRQADYEHQRA